MSEKIKIKDEELAELKLLHTKFQESIYKLGTHQIEKMELDRRVAEFIESEKKLKDEWLNLQKMDKDLLDKIIDSYGNGNLNIIDGTFEKTN